MLRSVIAVAIALALVGAGVGPASGQTIQGRLTTSLYAWERDPTDSTEANHLRAYQLGIFHLDGLGDRRLSFHTYVRAHGDLSADVNELANFRVFNLYGQWKDPGHGYEVRMGRMRVYAGVGNVAIDGGFGSYRAADFATLEAYAGVQPPFDGEAEVTSWDNRAYGGRLTLSHRPRDLKLALSFARRNRETIDYTQPGVYTGRLLALPAGQEELYGADFSWRIRPGATFYHRLELDRVQRRLKWGSAILTLAPPAEPWTADLEYFHRAPSLYGNSLLSVFDQEDYDEISGRVGYQITPELRLFSHLAATLYDGDNSERFGMGIERTGERTSSSLSYSRRAGYGGDLHSVVAAYQHAVGEGLTLRGQGGLSIYKLVAEQDERNLSFVAALGGEVRPRRNLAIDVELQNLTQDLHTQAAFAGNTFDLRGHLRVTYWFFSGRQAKGVF